MVEESKSNKWRYLNTIICKTSGTFMQSMEYMGEKKNEKVKTKISHSSIETYINLKMTAYGYQLITVEIRQENSNIHTYHIYIHTYVHADSQHFINTKKNYC